MRKKKAMINVCYTLLLEIVTVISGLIVPRLIIGAFGSEVNGLIGSITSFVAYITLLQTGVGSAIKSALYKPLAEKNNEELCVIIKTSNVFFKKIAYITVIYIAILMIVFPIVIVNNFEWVYTASLVAIVGASTAAQYFLGITYQMLFEADQKSYVYSIVQIVTVILNMIFVIILVNLGCSVQLVKFSSAIFFVARPIVLGAYAKKIYKINLDVLPNNSLINQRWDAFSQGIAYFIHSKTDIFVLTIFTSLKEVSIYTVYAMVTAGLSSIINSIDKSVRSAFGNIIACNEKNNLIRAFNSYNTLIHITATAFFSTASITVFAFVNVYISNISDANYYQPVFGLLLIAAEFIYCLRSPYNSIIYAAGKFKETKKSAGIEAIINIALSVILVSFFGLVGVAIGTFAAMMYRTISFVLYLKNEILELSIYSQLKRYLITVTVYVLTIYFFSKIKYSPANYLEWTIYAGIIFVLVILVTVSFNLLLDRDNTKKAMIMLIRRNKK